MDFLNKAFAQLSDLFKSMTPGARITSALLLAVVVVSLVWLVRQGTGAADEYLMGGEPFTASELAAAEAAFDTAGLRDYEIAGNKVRVPRTQRAAYMGALADAGAMPAAFGTYLSSAVTGSGPFTSDKQRVEMIRVAKQSELALVIRSMQGIDSASVLVDQETKPGFRQQRKATATVSIQPTSGQRLEDERVMSLRQLVAGAFANLHAADVTVVDLASGRYISGESSGGLGGASDAYTQAKLKHEREYEEKIRASLTYVPGAIVGVNVELNPETEKLETTSKLSPKTVTTTSDEDSESKNSETGAPGGRPGLEAQRPGGANVGGSVAAASNSSTTLEKNRVRQVSRPESESHTTTRTHGLTPDRVTVSVSVPQSYFKKVWQGRNPTEEGAEPTPPTDAELAKIEEAEIPKIQQHVAQLIKLPTTTVDPTPLVTVTTFPDLPTEVIAEPSFGERAFSWAGNNWSTIGMAGLALLSLVVLRSMVRSAPQADRPVTTQARLPVDEMEASQGDEEQEETKKTVERRLKRVIGGPSLRDELVEMVREDPDTAAKILRNWISTAS